MQKMKTQLCQKYITGAYQFRGYDRTMNLSLYAVFCLYCALLARLYLDFMYLGDMDSEH